MNSLVDLEQNNALITCVSSYKIRLHIHSYLLPFCRIPGGRAIKAITGLHKGWLRFVAQFVCQNHGLISLS